VTKIAVPGPSPASFETVVGQELGPDKCIQPGPLQCLRSSTGHRLVRVAALKTQPYAVAAKLEGDKRPGRNLGCAQRGRPGQQLGREGGGRLSRQGEALSKGELQPDIHPSLPGEVGYVGAAVPLQPPFPILEQAFDLQAD